VLSSAVVEVENQRWGNCTSALGPKHVVVGCKALWNLRFGSTGSQ